jgi:hypothetical protein
MPEAEDGMTHKRTCDALREQRQGHPGEAGEVCFDAPLCLNESTVGNGNHDAVVRAITGED